MTENEEHLLRRIGELSIGYESKLLNLSNELKRVAASEQSLLKQNVELQTENEQLKNTTRDMALSQFATTAHEQAPPSEEL